jgi:hypothetical protein
MKKLILILVLALGTLRLYADSRDNCYNYIGIWKIVKCFSIDGIMEEYLTVDEANNYIGEIIEYKDDTYIFRDVIYPIRRFLYLEYLTDEQLKEFTSGSASGAPGYRFSDLGIQNLKEIRVVMFDVVAEERTLGRWFYVLNNRRILIQYRGFFFTADRLV